VTTRRILRTSIRRLHNRNAILRLRHMAAIPLRSMGTLAIASSPSAVRCDWFCWAHVRRRFYELAAAGPAPIASEALERIAGLYVIEGDIVAAVPRQGATPGCSGAGRSSMNSTLAARQARPDQSEDKTR
jgi:hypothetical protein